MTLANPPIPPEKQWIPTPSSSTRTKRCLSASPPHESPSNTTSGVRLLIVCLSAYVFVHLSMYVFMCVHLCVCCVSRRKNCAPTLIITQAQLIIRSVFLIDTHYPSILHPSNQSINQPNRGPFPLRRVPDLPPRLLPVHTLLGYMYTRMCA